jgi:hypothetical protein
MRSMQSIVEESPDYVERLRPAVVNGLVQRWETGTRLSRTCQASRNLCADVRSSKGRGSSPGSAVGFGMRDR